jgi:hypothetical protein
VEGLLGLFVASQAGTQSCAVLWTWTWSVASIEIMARPRALCGSVVSSAARLRACAVLSILQHVLSSIWVDLLPGCMPNIMPSPMPRPRCLAVTIFSLFPSPFTPDSPRYVRLLSSRLCDSPPSPCHPLPSFCCQVVPHSLPRRSFADSTSKSYQGPIHRPLDVIVAFVLSNSLAQLQPSQSLSASPSSPTCLPSLNITGPASSVPSKTSNNHHDRACGLDLLIYRAVPKHRWIPVKQRSTLLSHLLP